MILVPKPRKKEVDCGEKGNRKSSIGLERREKERKKRNRGKRKEEERVECKMYIRVVERTRGGRLFIEGYNNVTR